jgi:hypothetical protein
LTADSISKRARKEKQPIFGDKALWRFEVGRAPREFFSWWQATFGLPVAIIYLRMIVIKGVPSSREKYG